MNKKYYMMLYARRKKLGRYTNCYHWIAVDLILKYNQKGSMLGRVKIYLFINKQKTM
jgi:hypothetical protein